MIIERTDIVNLTPHDVVVLGEGEKNYVFKSQGTIRLRQVERLVGKIDGIPVVSVEYGEVELKGISKEELKGKDVIVSNVVAQAKDLLKKELGVRDILVPNTGKAIRDENGRIVGVPSLILVE